MNIPPVKDGIAPWFIRTKSGHLFQPKAIPVDGAVADKRVFRCLCGFGVAWCKDPDGTFYVCNVTSNDISHRRSRRAFYEYRYDRSNRHDSTRCQHATQTLYNAPHRRMWLWTGLTYEIVWAPVTLTPDASDKVTVLLDERFRERVVSAANLYA